MKATMKTMMGLSVLLTLAGCYSEKKEWQDTVRNEVTDATKRTARNGGTVYMIEQRMPASDALRVCDVVFINPSHLLQRYHIEGHTVINYHHLLRHDAKVDMPEEKYYSAFTIFLNLDRLDTIPERVKEGFDFKELERLNMSAALSGDSPILTVIEAYSNRRDESFGVRKWTGATNGVPSVITAFYQNVIQKTSLPEYAKSYPSYLRAIPLLTEVDMEAEKDTPVIDSEKARYHTEWAIFSPYTLIPIPEKKSPFPAVRKYAPGDKFRVNYWDKWFLIETFKGEGKYEPPRDIKELVRNP